MTRQEAVTMPMNRTNVQASRFPGSTTGGEVMRLMLCFVLLGVVFASAAGAADHTVTMSGLTYRPPALTVRVGDAIRLINDDGTDHHVFVPTGGFAIDFGPQKPGTTVEMPLGKAGTFEVECVFHPHMLLTVTVSR